MADMVQYIQLNEIVPGEIHPHLENANDNLDNLTNSIKNYGILEPLIVRPKDNIYEIILGNRRYKAAKRLNLQKIPAIILNIDDAKALEIIISDNIQRKELTAKEEALLYNQALSISNNSKENLSHNLGIPLDRINSKLNLLEKKPKNIISKSNPQKTMKNTNNAINSDIINLSELNKKEVEREDKDMNNSNFINNNNQLNENPQTEGVVNQSSQEPTFGGKFFPSLEDEPTNMNLNTNFNDNQLSMNMTNSQPSPLIDLTDLSPEKSVNNSPIPPQQEQPRATDLNQLSQPMPEPIAPSPIESMPEQLSQPISNNIAPMQSSPQKNVPLQTESPQLSSSSELITNSLNNNEGVINSQELSSIPTQSLQNQNQMNVPESYQRIEQSEQNINLQSPQTLNSQINIPINPTPDSPNLNQNMPTMSEINNMNPNISTEQQFSSELTTPNQDNTSLPASPIDNNLDLNIHEKLESFSNSNLDEKQSGKDIIPIINMIKNLGISIQSLGYNLKIDEIDSDNSYKIEIEVEK